MEGIKVTLGSYGTFHCHIREVWGGIKVTLRRYGRFQGHIREVWEVSRSH